MGADEGSQEPFLLEGTSTLPLLLSFEKCVKQQLQLTEMLLEFENLTFSFFLFLFSFFFLKKTKQNKKHLLAPLWEAVCQRISVITHPLLLS